MANKTKDTNTVKVTYTGDSSLPSGVIGRVPESGKTYEIKASHWEKKKNANGWALANTPVKKKTKKKAVKKSSPVND